MHLSSINRAYSKNKNDSPPNPKYLPVRPLLKDNHPNVQIVSTLDQARIPELESLIRNSANRIRKSSSTLFPYQQPDKKPPVRNHDSYNNLLFDSIRIDIKNESSKPRSQRASTACLQNRRNNTGPMLYTPTEQTPTKKTVMKKMQVSDLQSQCAPDVLAITKESRCVSAKPLLRNQRTSRGCATIVDKKVRESMVSLYDQIQKQHKMYIMQKKRAQQRSRLKINQKSGSKNQDVQYDDSSDLLIKKGFQTARNSSFHQTIQISNNPISRWEQSRQSGGSIFQSKQDVF